MNYKKTIVVTGGAGFIGSNYLNQFVRTYPEYFFLNVDALTYAGNLKNIAVAKEKNYAFEKIDIRNRKALGKIFKKYRPTHIIHFAAESHVDVSITNPSIFIETNILGTHNLLLLAKEFGVKRFHHISTDEVYGSLNPMDADSKESDALAPNSPYSASKAAGEMLVRSYNHTFGLNTVITRSSNNYGPHQYKEKFIPLFITHLLNNKKVPLYGTGKNIRNWIHVADNVAAIDRVFHDGASGEIYNIGGETELENIEVVRMLLKLTNKRENLVQYVTDRLGHDMRYALDSSKIKKTLGWKPRITFEKGLAETVALYKAALSG